MGIQHCPAEILLLVVGFLVSDDAAPDSLKARVLPSTRLVCRTFSAAVVRYAFAEFNKSPVQDQHLLGASVPHGFAYVAPLTPTVLLEEAKLGHRRFPPVDAICRTTDYVLDALSQLGRSDVESLRDTYQRILCHDAAKNGYHGRLADSVFNSMRFQMDSYTGALTAAVASNDMELLKMLLGRDAEVRLCWPFGNPLCLATTTGNDTAVPVLLQSGKNVAVVDTGSRDPYQTLRPILTAAVAAGNIDVLKTLGYRYAAVLREGSPTRSRSLLSLAAEKGNTAVVEFLLKVPSIHPTGSHQGISPPFIYAAKHGHVDIVKIFLARYPQEVIALGSDALRLAAMMGHDAVVQLLIKHPMVSPNKLGMSHLAPTHLVMLEDVLDDGPERSTLSYAAEAGYTKIVRILLGSGQTAVDRPDSRGRTPLYHAAAGGNADVVQLFLDCGACDLAPEKRGLRNPLGLAAERGHEQVVKMLLHRKPRLAYYKGRREELRFPLQQKADKSTLSDIYSITMGTALSYAAGNGHTSVMRLLLERGACANGAMVTGKTPLSYAARGGFLEAVKLLGERGDVEMNPVGGEPLVLAASHGHSEAVEYLTGKPGVRVNVAIHDQTAIYHACEKGFRGIFDILTSRSDTIVVKEYQQGIDLLSVAAKGVSNLSARAYIMATLLDKYGMDPNSRDDSGFTPLMHAVLHGDVSTVRFLLDRGAEVDSRSRDGATPLMLAAARARLGITKVLIARGKADTSARDNAGKTALFYAAEGSFGQSTSLAFAQDQAAPIELLRFLLSCEGVSPCTLDYSGKSASFYATSLGSSAERMLNPAMEKEPLQWFS